MCKCCNCHSFCPKKFGELAVFCLRRCSCTYRYRYRYRYIYRCRCRCTDAAAATVAITDTNTDTVAVANCLPTACRIRRAADRLTTGKVSPVLPAKASSLATIYWPPFLALSHRKSLRFASPDGQCCQLGITITEWEKLLSQIESAACFFCWNNIDAEVNFIDKLRLNELVLTLESGKYLK